MFRERQDPEKSLRALERMTSVQGTEDPAAMRAREIVMQMAQLLRSDTDSECVDL